MPTRKSLICCVQVCAATAKKRYDCYLHIWASQMTKEKRIDSALDRRRATWPMLSAPVRASSLDFVPFAKGLSAGAGWACLKYIDHIMLLLVLLCLKK